MILYDNILNRHIITFYIDIEIRNTSTQFDIYGFITKFRIMDRFRNYKFGDITKGITKKVGSAVAHDEDKKNDKSGDIPKGGTKTVESGVAHVEDKKNYKFGDITKGVIKTVGSED